MIQLADVYYPMYEDNDKMIILVTGGRGCETPTQEIVMADLSVKMIKNIKVGDLVMGDDGTPRKVLGTMHGTGMMYKVHQSNAEDYFVNESHILTVSDGKTVKDINVIDYMNNPTINGKYKGFKVVNMTNKKSTVVCAYSDLTITENGIGEWCGISLDGNQRYIHSDGTVTHNSGKSFSTGTFIERLTFEAFPKHDNPDETITHTILYTRYTMVSAAISVIPEMLEKIDLDGVSQFFKTTRSDVQNLMTGAKIMFRGIHTSSGNQTAKLKSIHGITTFVVDEAEEWTSEEEFDKIMLSIRQKGIRNRVIIIMNPTDSNHFVYRRFIKDTHKIVEYDGVPVQISTHPDVLHIHTTYLDNIDNLSEDFIRQTKGMKEDKPEKYAHTVMGQWADVAEGAVFKKWGIVDKFPDEARKVALGVDFGYSCFTGDTLITTKRGLIPIKDINETDFVLTRQGYKKVLKKINNGFKKTYKKILFFSDKSVIFNATNEHYFNANNQWKQYSQLTKGDKLYTLLNLTELSIEDTQIVNTLITSIIKGNNCIEQFMSFIKEKSQKDTSYTILIKILSITISKILLQLHPLNTVLCILKKSKNLKKARNKQVTNTDTRLKIGNKDGKKLLIIFNLLKELAFFVEHNLHLQIHINDFVPNHVIKNGNYKHPKIILRWCVNIAEKLSWAINIISQNVAATNAPISYCGLIGIKTISSHVEQVYDLTIEGVHEYFANGILVHNCDVTAIVKCGIVDDRLYIEELCYETHMLISDIIAKLKPHKDLMVIADSADPRLIQEIFNGGILIYPVIKGGGSILAGIEKMKDMELFVTKDSYNLQEELRNYVWDKDKNGNYTKQPIDKYNHCFVGETLVTTKRGKIRFDRLKLSDEVLTSGGYHKITKFFNQGVKKVVCVRLTFDGFFIDITATPDHKIRTDRGWVELAKLTIGDVLFVHRNGIFREKILAIKYSAYSQRQVYDIEVEKQHEFFANGILVSNCIDASRYYVLGKILGQITKPVKYNAANLGIF